MLGSVSLVGQPRNSGAVASQPGHGIRVEGIECDHSVQDALLSLSVTPGKFLNLAILVPSPVGAVILSL